MLKKWLEQQISGKFPKVEFDILIPPDGKLGDYSTNIAFVLAKKWDSRRLKKKDPSKIGDDLVREFSEDKEFKKIFKKIEFVKPGFINFYFSDGFLKNTLKEVLEKREKFGNSDIGKDIKINLEFVSANPVGPLTVANIRAASFGDTLANVLKKSGYEVTKEYYINDVGVQVRTLGESVAKRYLQLKGKIVEFEDKLYQGDYIVDIAKEIKEENLFNSDDHFDEMVDVCKKYAVEKFIGSAKKSLEDLGVRFDVWFSEKQLHDSGEVKSLLEKLELKGHVYEKDGARWLKVGEILGKEIDDAVLVKSDSSTSYLMNDIAYSNNKFKRGFDKAINIWGADHHGDVPRLLAGVKALGLKKKKLEVLLHQLVLIKNKDKLQRMSKRKGEFVLLDDLLKEVGKDAARFFFMMKDLNTHMEFDVDLAKERSKNNPVYYIQYASARLNNIFEKLRITTEIPGFAREPYPRNYELRIKGGHFKLLKEEEELKLLRDIAAFPDVIEDIAGTYNVHHLAGYALSLATDFHKFYEKHRVVNDDKELESARAELCRGVYTVLKLCLDIMGISAPEKM